MSNSNPFKSGTAALLALAITSSAVVPLLTAVPAFAQYRSPQDRFPQRDQNFPRREQLNNLVIPSGTTIRVRYDREKVVLMPDETVPLTLKVSEAVRASDGTVLIPRDSELSGELRPTYRGTQFVAKEVTLYRRRVDEQSRPFPINATSNVVTRIEEVKQGANTGSIATGAAIGAGAAAALSAITGDRSIGALEVLGGAGAGALGGLLLNRKTANMVVVYPEQDLTVRLSSEFALRR